MFSRYTRWCPSKKSFSMLKDSKTKATCSSALPLRRPEGVVARRNVGPHGVDDAKIRHPPRGLDRWKQFRQQLLVAFAVDEDDGHAASDVLFGHGLEEIRFPGPGHPKGVRLHGPCLVRPVERLPEDVVAEQDGGTAARFFEVVSRPAGESHAGSAAATRFPFC